ncbi:MAG: hypothetical protein Q9160_004120 [Pyrenula sp. 1 TL-2023]
MAMLDCGSVEVSKKSFLVLPEVFTPTSLSISGVTPPITKATTVTTTDNTGQTVAIAIGVGAGVVGAGALAAWLFKPVPGAPPAPTEPPPYSTASQPSTTNDPSTSTTSSSTTEETYACPFTKVDAKAEFTSPPVPPKWTGNLPQQTASSIKPSCTQQGGNNQLYRGTDPGYVNDLAGVFCKSDLSKDQSKTIGQTDLPNDSKWKNTQLDGIRVKFDFKFAAKHDDCPQNCVDSYSGMITSCQYNSHVVYGGDSLEQGCGTYSYMIDADPRTELKCNPLDSRGVFYSYEYRDSALESIRNFCGAQKDKTLKQKDESSYIKETVFSATYSDQCQGSGEYKIDQELCEKYLTQMVDGCDTDSTMYKHGGTVTNTDNCGSFSFNPKGFDSFDCYPSNKDHGYITAGTHKQVTPDVANDAINAFCDRSGDGQTYTLDPSVTPDSSGFVQDTCKEAGSASCGYFYTNDGKRVTEDGNIGDFNIRMNAAFMEPEGFPCGARQKYDIHGDR